MEMSFLEEKDIFAVIEEVLKEIFKEVHKTDLKTPFPRFTYEEAMSRYGSDKPDLRFGMEFQDVSEAVKGADFKVFQDVLSKPKGSVVGFTLKGGAEISRSEVDSLTEFVKGEGALGLAYYKVGDGKLDSPIAKFLSPEIQQKLIQTMRASPGDLLLFIADERPKALKILGALRLHVAKWKKLIPEGQFHFSWVLDFPLFKYNEEEKRWESEHHPFTSPNEEDWKEYKKSNAAHPEKVRSRAYDIVLNGNEIGSGSVRIHNEARQKEIFNAIGLEAEEIEKRFGFLLKAFKFGAPPHGGIALGIDRVITILLGLESIREVIAFPKNQKAVCPMTEAPSPVSERQLKELGIKIR
jgi:aspartyl-tRNA synthetase